MSSAIAENIEEVPAEGHRTDLPMEPEGMKTKPRRLPEEVKQEVVRRVVEQGHSVADVAKELGVSDSAVHGWVRISKEVMAKDEENQHLKEKVSHLEKKNAQLEKQRDILLSLLEDLAGGGESSDR